MTISPITQNRLHLALAWLLAATVLFLQLGVAPLTDIDEGAFSEATREMLARGDWISPWLLDLPRFDKPALTHWAQMVGFWLLGPNAWGARLHSALAGLVWIGGIGGWAYLMARRIKGLDALQVYAWAVLIAGTSLAIPAMARSATADGLLNAFLVISLLLIWQALFTPNSRRYARLAAVVMALGLLTKGPVAVVLPGLASLLAALTTGQLRAWLRMVADPLAWLILLAIALPWYVLQLQAQGVDFLQGFFGVHNLERIARPMHGFSAGPLYTPAFMAVGLLPWLPLLLGSLLRPDRLGAPELRMAWTIALVVAGLFALVATKLPHYGFYGLSGLIALMAVRLVQSRLAKGQALSWANTVWQSLLLIGMGLLPVWFSLLPAQVQDPYIAGALQTALLRFEAVETPLLGLMVIGVLGLLFAQRAFRFSLIVLPGLLAVFLFGYFVPEAMQALRGPIRVLGQEIRENRLAAPDLPLISWRLQSPSLSFEAQRVIPSQDPTAAHRVVLHDKHRAELERLLAELPVDQRPETLELIWQQGGIQVLALSAPMGAGARTAKSGQTSPAAQRPQSPKPNRN